MQMALLFWLFRAFSRRRDGFTESAPTNLCLGHCLAQWLKATARSGVLQVALFWLFPALVG